MRYVATIIGAALVAASALALDGFTRTIGPASPTGGVVRVRCANVDVQRLDWSLDQPGVISIERRIGDSVLSTIAITNGVGPGTMANIGVLTSFDAIKLTATTNTVAIINAVGD